MTPKPPSPETMPVHYHYVGRDLHRGPADDCTRCFPVVEPEPTPAPTKVEDAGTAVERCCDHEKFLDWWATYVQGSTMAFDRAHDAYRDTEAAARAKVIAGLHPNASERLATARARVAELEAAGDAMADLFEEFHMEHNPEECDAVGCGYLASIAAWRARSAGKDGGGKR